MDGKPSGMVLFWVSSVEVKGTETLPRDHFFGCIKLVISHFCVNKVTEFCAVGFALTLARV